MRLRPYIEGKDFEVIKEWEADERTHTMWCANHFTYPLEKMNVKIVLEKMAEQYNDSAYVATTDEGEVIGFFGYSTNLETNEGYLKFVMIDPAKRGKGYGKEMISLTVKYAFEIAKAEGVRLKVFSNNESAKKCYAGVVFSICKEYKDVFPYKNERWGVYEMIVTRK